LREQRTHDHLGALRHKRLRPAIAALPPEPSSAEMSTRSGFFLSKSAIAAAFIMLEASERVVADPLEKGQQNANSQRRASRLHIAKPKEAGAIAQQRMGWAVWRREAGEAPGLAGPASVTRRCATANRPYRNVDPIAHIAAASGKLKRLGQPPNARPWRTH